MILLTGATGLLGAHLALQLLEQGNEIRAIYRSPKSLEKAKSLFHYKNKLDLWDKIHWVEADLTDIIALEHAFEGVKQVFHCAALVSFDPKDQEKMRQINIQGTANLINLAIDFKIDKFCHVSSIAALGQPIESCIAIDEKTPWNPETNKSYYSISKYGAEMEVWRGSQENLKVIIVNPGIIFADGFQWGPCADMIQKIKKGVPFYTKGSTGIVYVQDVVDSMIQLMQSPIYNQRYTLVSNTISYKDLLNYISMQLGNKKIAKIKAGKFLSTIAYSLDAAFCAVTKSKRSFTRDMARSANSISIYNTDKIEKFLHRKLTDYTQYLPLVVDYFKNK
ncbi:NAD-dependent epimerase/dehydratase family protein [Myroides sp. LJL115]